MLSNDTSFQHIKNLNVQYIFNIIKLDLLEYLKEINQTATDIQKTSTGSSVSNSMLNTIVSNSFQAMVSLKDCLCLLNQQIEQKETREIMLDSIIEKTIDTLKENIKESRSDIKLLFNAPKKKVLIQSSDYLIESIILKMYEMTFKSFEDKTVEFSYSIDSTFPSITLKYIGHSQKMIDLINEPKLETTMNKNLSHFNNSFSMLKLLEHLRVGVLSFAHQDNYSIINFTLHVPSRVIKSEIHSETNESQTSFNWKDKTVLIVDDIEVNYMFLQTILSETNVKTIYASNGQVAVNECKNRNDIHAVLMDLKMPVMDGYQATSIIKELNPTLPVIVQTAYSFSEEFEKCVKLGCNDFITKPLKSENVLSVLAKYLN